MSEKDWYAVGNRDGQGRSPIDGHMAVRFVASQPPGPGRVVHEDVGAVDLLRRRQPWSGRTQLALKLGPPAHHVTHGLVRVQPKASSRPGRGECANAELGEVGCDLRLG
ncbi:MAG TPA: hypothetical protein VFS57_10105, partial [Gemmatimonadaceae bacterium]|nr:hypothetical protein [Gemmatimonadaceae bacterium]